MDYFEQILNAVVAGNISKTKGLVADGLDSGIAGLEIVDKALLAGLDVVGERFGKGEMFVPEMMLSAIAVRESMPIATKDLRADAYKPKACIVLGTVKGDLHDIGKNLVTLFLRSAGYEVVDLGVDVKVEDFTSAIQKHKPSFLGLSCLMTTTMPGMKDVISSLTEAGLRNEVKILVGGAPVNDEFASQIGADAYCRDASAAAVTLNEFLSGAKD